MFVDPSNYVDADKYFRTCFIKVKEYGDVLVRIDKVTEEALWGEDQNGEGVCIEINGQETGTVGYTLDYVIPKKAYFQVGQKAAFLTRIPARMWKKGISKENTQLYLLGPGGFSGWGVSFESLKAYVEKPQYLPFTETKNQQSVALSPRFAMNGTDVYLDLTMIGRYYPTGKTLVCKKLFIKDLTPLFPGVKIVKG